MVKTTDSETKSIIRSLVASTPLKSTIRSILKDYYDTVGFELPFRQLGFNNPELYLRSIPDVVQVVGSGPHAEVLQVRSQKLDHINQMVSKQRIPKAVVSNKRRPVIRSRVVGSNHTPSHQYNMHPSIAYPPPPPSFNYYQRNMNNRALVAKIPRQPYLNQQNHQDNRSYPKPPQQKKSLPPKQTTPIPQQKYPLPQQLSPLPQLSSPSPPQSESSLRSSVFEAATTSTPFEERVEPLTLSPRINKKYMEDKMLYIKGGDNLFYDEIEERVPEGVKNNLRDLIGDHPEGIWCCDLPKLYRSRYLTELDYAAYKFRTLNEMCLYLASIFHYIRPNKGDFKLYDKTAPIPEDLSVQVCLDGNEVEGSTANDADDLEKILNLESLGFSDEPSNVVQYLEDIPRQWLSRDQKEGVFIDVWIAEVYDPSKFWFIINKQKLDDMMNEMQVYYSSNKHKYVVPKHKLREGLYCCAILFGEYHRAIVVAKSATSTDSKIKLYFIDYGTVAKVEIKGICYLHRRYAVMPQQALRGRLAGVYPPGAQQQWSREVCTRFFDMIAEKPLVAKIEKINLQKQFVHLTLIEAPAKESGDTPIYINEVLLNEGFAVASPEAQEEVEMKFAVPIVRHLHFYPTYEELEQGLVPTAPEMINLLHNGCSLELIYPQYFQRTCYKHEMQKLREEVFQSQCVSSDESFDAHSSCSSNATTDECKSSGMDEAVNFTEDLIPDKGGTCCSSETDTTEEAFPQNQVALKALPPAPTKMQEKKSHSPKAVTDEVPSSETQHSHQKSTRQEVVEELPPSALTLKPPPGFERVRPNVAVQQNFMTPPQNYGYSPIVQQNYYLPPYGAYQMPYGFPLQIPYNYYQMYPFPQMVPPVPPQLAPVEPIISEYINSLKNDKPVIIESESTDSEVISCGTLANEDDSKELKKKDLKTKIEMEIVETTGDEVQELEKNESDIKPVQEKEVKKSNSKNEPIETKIEMEIVKTTDEVQKREKNKSKIETVQEEEIKKDNSKHEPKQPVSESEQNTKKKRRKHRRHKISESEQIEADSKLKRECEKAQISANREVVAQNKTKNQVEEKTAKQNVNKQSTPEKSKSGKSESVSSKTDKRKEDIDSDNTKIKFTQNKTKIEEYLVEKQNINNNPTSQNETEETSNPTANEQVVENWELLVDEEAVCLLDTTEVELVSVLSRPGSRNDSSLAALQKFLVDDTAPLQPQRICDVNQECNEETIERTTQLETQKCVEKKVVSGKTICIVTWEQKPYFVFTEALKTYTGLELPVVSTKIRLARRKIFMKDIDVNTIETDVQEELIRHNLVTASKFGKFVHLIHLEQLQNFIETLMPGMELHIMDVL